MTGKKKTAIKKTTEKKDGRSRATIADEITDYKWIASLCLTRILELKIHLRIRAHDLNMKLLFSHSVLHKTRCF